MSSSQRLKKPKLPITPTSSKAGSSYNNAAYSKPLSVNSFHPSVRQADMHSNQKKPKLDITSSLAESPIRIPTPSSKETITPLSSQLHVNSDWNTEEDDDDLLLATLDYDAEPLQSSFKENMVTDQNLPGPSKNTVPTSKTIPSFQPHSLGKGSSSNTAATLTSKISSCLKTQENILSVNLDRMNTGTNKNNDPFAKKLKEMGAELTARDGEVKILRQDLQKKDKLVFDLKTKHQQELEALKLENEQKFNLLKKDYEKICTEFKFQTRDIADSEEKMRAMRCSLKKVSPGSPDSKSKHQSQQPHSSGRILFRDDSGDSDSQKKKITSPRRDRVKIELYPRLDVDVHSGKILYNMLYPTLFLPPEQENEIFVDQLESTKSMNVPTIKNVLTSTQTLLKPDSDQSKNKSPINKNEASNQSSKLISFPQIPFIPLYTMKSLDAECAQDIIRKIFLKCSKVLEKFLLVLRNAVKYDEQYEKRVCKLATSCFKIALGIKEHSLFDPQRWYTEERGIEIRRTIAVLSALASSSVHAVNLILQTSFSGLECDLANLFSNSLRIVESRKSTLSRDNVVNEISSSSKKRKLSSSNSPEQRKIPRLSHMEPSTSKMIVDIDTGCSPPQKTSSNIGPAHHSSSPSCKSGHKQKICPSEKFDTLQIILDIVAEIRIQYRTISFNGVLAAIVSLLRSLADTGCDIPCERLNLISNIIKEIVFCCPCPAVIYQVIFLMVPLARYLTFTNSLCINSPQDTFIDSLRHYTFTTSTCILQVLCTECEMIEKTPVFAESIMQWALKLTLKTSHCPDWLAGDCRMFVCDCFPRFIQLVLNVFYLSVQSYGDDDRPVSELSKQQLESVMKCGIIVLYHLILQRNDFLHQVGSWDGLYEAIINHLLQLSKRVSFESPIFDMLNDLICLKQVDSPESAYESQFLGEIADEELGNHFNSFKRTSRSTRRIAHPNIQIDKNVTSKKLRRKSARKS